MVILEGTDIHSGNRMIPHSASKNQTQSSHHGSVVNKPD